MGDGMLARKAAALSFLSSISTVSPAHQQLQLTDGAHNSQGPSGKGSVPPMRVLSSPAEETTSSEGAWTPKQRATISFLRNIDLGSSHPVSESSGLSRALSHSLDALESPRPTASDAEVLACPTDVFADPPPLRITSWQLEQYRNGDLKSIPERLLEGRILFVSASGAPLTLFSMLPLTDKLKPKRHRNKTLGMFGGSYFEKMGLGIAMDAVNKRKRAESFAVLLEPAHTLISKGPLNSGYNPFLVDDPEFQTGRNKTIITLPCFRGSVIQHSKASEVRKAQNEYFKERLPGLDASITLAEIRDLKDKMIEVGKLQDLEISSVASAFVYFEKLTINSTVNYTNRKVVAGCCLLLAAKVNDPKERDYNTLLDCVDRVLDVSAKEVYTNEFSIYAALEFSLFVPAWEISSHIERILVKRPDLDPEDFLGVAPNQFYMGM